MPDAAAVKTAIADIQKLFKDDFTAAKKPDLKTALAEKLLGLAADSSTPLERFALLSEAKRLAVAAADIGLAMQAIDALAAQFGLDRFTLAADLADSLASKDMPAPARQALVETVAPLVDEAVADGQIAAARRLATVGLAAARRGNQVEIGKVLVRQLHDLATQEKLAEAAEAAREQLKSKPDDADAHLALGKYLCFAVGNWREGLSHLQQGTDASLRGAAEREAEGAESAADRMKVGDLWWDLSDDQKGADKDRYRSRAGYWYEQAVGELTGLSKTKVEKRLADFPKQAATAKPGRAKATQFLSELVPQDVRTYSNGLPLPSVLVAGVPSVHGFFLHPNENTSSHVLYDVAGRYSSLTGKVGINDTAASMTPTMLTFRIVGDGREIWRSKPLRRTGESQEFHVNLRNVRQLELFVDCPGDNHGAHAVWIEPQLILAAATTGGTPSPRGASDLFDRAVLIATFDEPTIVRENGEIRVRDLSSEQKPGLLNGGTLVKGKAGQAISLAKIGDYVDWEMPLVFAHRY